MRTGVSVYLSGASPASEAVIERAHRARVRYAFTSLHVSEETGADARAAIRRVLSWLRDADIALIADVGPETCARLGCERIEDLRDWGVSHVRLDYGFDAKRVAALSRVFHLVFNASTVGVGELRSWHAAAADLTRFAACHNFYPKRETGLSLEQVRRANARLGAYGLETMAFVPGDGRLRGPLFEGLPTVEAHRDRRDDVALNMLELACAAGCDTVIVGDPDLRERSWERVGQLSRGHVDIRCEVAHGYEYLYGQVHHDRPDSSERVFRSQESRASLAPGERIEPDALAGAARERGAIAVSNAGYGRYEGELEISRCDLSGDPRVNVVGRVAADDARLLPYIREGFGARLVAVD